MRILLVRPRLIGDVVLTTPAVRALRRQFPQAELIYAVEPLAAPVVQANPHLNDVVVLPYRRGWRRFVDDLRLAARLRARRIDIAIDFHGGPRSSWLTWATRARRRVGYDVPGRSWMYTDVVARTHSTRHSIFNQWDLVAAVDPALAAPPSRTADGVEMPASAEARASLEARLTALGVTPAMRVIVLHVSARNTFRRWPESSFADVAAALVRGRTDRAVIVMGGPSDREAAGRVIASARERAGADGGRVLAGEGWTLAELRAAMDRASAFIGGDSGPLHIASASRVPIVALYGPTVPSQWAPWRSEALPFRAIDAGPLPCRPCAQRVCEPGDFRCLTRIAAGDVSAAAEELLEAAQ